MGIPMVLQEETLVWFESLEEVVKGDWDQLKQALWLHFACEVTAVDIEAKLKALK